jgi:5-methylcytosine-specific restriction endonuclease McrA
MDLRKIKDALLMEQFKALVKTELQITAEIICYIKEIDTRKLYLKSHPSLFAFLTLEMGYANASAQRRIDAARMMRENPEIKQDIASGELTLSQISLTAQSVRQKRKTGAHISKEEKAEILKSVKNKTIEETQKALCLALDVAPVVIEKKRVQGDDSVRIEMTLTKEQLLLVERAKELLSHTHPGASMAELFTHLAEFLIAKKDPLVKKMREKSATSDPVTSAAEVASGSAEEIQATIPPTSAAEVDVTPVDSANTPRSPHIPRATVRAVHHRDGCCQWKDKATGQICGSRFQLQTDHIKPRWDGGTHELANLQILCAAHNRWKYDLEAGIRST